MTRTRRLYWHDPLRFTCESDVLELVRRGDRVGVVLPETVFYPEAGGQLADLGWLDWDAGRLPLVDAQEDESGRVLHLLDAPPDAAPPPGARVRVSVDERRRRDHMSQHTGQHLLSRALLDQADAATISSRLGDRLCTIDTPLAAIADGALADAVALVNSVIAEDRPVSALMPTADELAKLPLRREPKVTDEVRVIDIDGFDLSPCGGTHCLRTGQVGLVHVLGVERHKGGLRLTFQTGRRAHADLALKDRLLDSMARDLTCGWQELPGVVGKLRSELRDLQRNREDLTRRLAEALASGLLARHPGDELRVIAAGLGAESVEVARAVAAALARAAGVVAIVWADVDGGRQLIVERAASDDRVDAGAVLKRIAQACGGRGGGRGPRAEGRVPAGTGLDAAVAAERERLGAAPLPRGPS